MTSWGSWAAAEMGVVYQARQARLDRLVAIKILPAEAARDPNFVERFTREARALARLNHPNIITVHDFGQYGDRYYFVMEFVAGSDLRQRLRLGPIPPPEAFRIVSHICDALDYAHREGIVHRDIKPENILLDKNNRIKIADFGIAKLLSHNTTNYTLTGPWQVVGTWHYMAPEQLDNPRGLDQRADIYSLGVMFYEMLTGKLPQGKFPSPSQVSPVDARVDDIVLRALEREPERRFQAAAELKAALESLGAQSQARSHLHDSAGTTIFESPRAGSAAFGQGAAPTWQHWVMLAIIVWVYVISFVLLAYRVTVRYTSGPAAGQDLEFTVSGWEYLLGFSQHLTWWANPVFWVGCGLLAFRKWLWAGLVAQAAMLQRGGHRSRGASRGDDPRGSDT